MLLKQLPNVELTLLIGQYAQKYFLKSDRKPSLTETVKAFNSYGPAYIPLVHPSPRNVFWLQKNKWFEKEVIPYLQKRVKASLKAKFTSD